MSEKSPTPPRLNLEQQRRRAKELLRAVRSGEPEAVLRVRRHHPHLAGRSTTDSAPLSASFPFALHDALWVVARENGFPSWPALKHSLGEASAARAEPLRPFVRTLSYYEERARGLQSVVEDGLPRAIALARKWHPRFAALDATAACAEPFDESDARLVLARQHGSDSWDTFAIRIKALADGTAYEPLAAAFEGLERRRVDVLSEVLNRHPELIGARGTNGNTLLALACSFGTSGCWMGATAAMEAVRLLLSRGADPNEANDRGFTPLHQAGYGNHPELARLLIEAGADVDAEAYGEGGTPLAFALFWGHREAAEFLAEHGVVPRNLRIAAGLGREDLLDELMAPDGTLHPFAGAGRGFYRPHTGFPAWTPGGDPVEVRNEALVWAAKSGRVAAIRWLAARGADVNGDPYRGTPLAWAAGNGRLEAIRTLLALGADVNLRATFGGPSHGQGVTALHLAAQDGHAEAARLLVEAGADVDLRDDLYTSTAWGWAEHFGHRELAAYLRSHAREQPE